MPVSFSNLGSILVEYALHKFAGSIADARAELLDLKLQSGKDLRNIAELLIEFNLLRTKPDYDLNILENSFSLDSALPPVEIPPPDPFLPIDLACCSCLYNLRGLPWNANCSECSTPLWQTLHRLADGRIPAPQQMIQQALRTWHKHIAHTAGHRIDALLFVRDALLTHCDGVDNFSSPPEDLPPAIICECVRRHARGYFNDPAEAAEVLKDSNLCTANDLIQIATAIAQYNLLRFKIDPQAPIPQFELAPPASGL